MDGIVSTPRFSHPDNNSDGLLFPAAQVLELHLFPGLELAESLSEGIRTGDDVAIDFLDHIADTDPRLVGSSLFVHVVQFTPGIVVGATGSNRGALCRRFVSPNFAGQEFFPRRVVGLDWRVKVLRCGITDPAVDADYKAAQVEERPTGIAGSDGAIGLQERRRQQITRPNRTTGARPTS